MPGASSLRGGGTANRDSPKGSSERMLIAVNLETIAMLLIGAFAGYYVASHMMRTGKAF